MEPVRGTTFLAVLFSAGLSLEAASHTVATGLDDGELSTLLFGPESPISLIGSPTITGNSQAYGSFQSSLLSGIPFADGVVLSTGSILNSIGPNDFDSTGTAFNSPGSPYLDAVAGSTTHDAITLTFQFQSTSSAFSLQYLFASEEYHPLFAGEYNDLFAILLDGPGYAGQNIATLGPSAVSIATVNQNVNSQYFYNNAGGVFDIEFNGLAGSYGSQYLYANAEIQPGQTYTLSIVLADLLDPSLDSALFFGYTTVEPVPEPGAMIGGTALFGLLALRRLRR